MSLLVDCYLMSSFLSCSMYMYYVLGDVKSLVFSGKAPVDSLCGIKDNTHVFTEGDDIWDVMLNQVSL